MRRDNGSDPGSPASDRPASSGSRVADIPVAAGSVRWERPTARSFWNALADPEREALAAAGEEEIFRAGAVLCRAGDDTSHVMIIDSGWVKVSIRDGSTEKIVAVRGQGDVVGERAALTDGVRSATVTALDEVSAMVIPAERFAEFLRGHPRAAEVLERQVTERREEDRGRLFPADWAGAERDAAERRLAWLLSDLAHRRGGHQHTVFTLPMSQQELADWAGTSADAVGDRTATLSPQSVEPFQGPLPVATTMSPVAGSMPAPPFDQIAESLDEHVDGWMISWRLEQSEFQTWPIRPLAADIVTTCP